MEEGFSPEMYRNTTDFQIMKKENVTLLKKMRQIWMLNSEFNQNNKWMSRKMLYNAEKYNIIAEEQYGSRKKHNSITMALNKQLTFDILQQQKKAAIFSPSPSLELKIYVLSKT